MIIEHHYTLANNLTVLNLLMEVNITSTTSNHRTGAVEPLLDLGEIDLAMLQQNVQSANRAYQQSLQQLSLLQALLAQQNHHQLIPPPLPSSDVFGTATKINPALIGSNGGGQRQGQR